MRLDAELLARDIGGGMDGASASRALLNCMRFDPLLPSA